MAIKNPTREVAISDGLSRRQRQILEVLFELGEASAETVRTRMPIPPSNSAVRATLKIMEDRGLVVRKAKDLHYVYSPVEARDTAQTSAIHRLVRTFFGNSAEQAMLALLGVTKEQLSSEQLDRIQQMIVIARAKQRNKT
ncbi:MAG: BlaI/MecI/CopY family transcriptional regulator [Opitutaceae bacterium]|jgi:predicted transcriptional regulator